MFLFGEVAVLGAGLLGASLGAALKARGLCRRVRAWSRSEATRAKCAEAAWCDSVCGEISGATEGADLVVLSSTPGSIPRVAAAAVPSAKTGAVFTDVGSTKARIVSACAPLFEGADFFYVPSHPMAGSDKSGPEHADADLFEGAACFVCPTQNPEADSAVRAMWEAVGMRVFEKSPEEHDRIAAAVSHVPQCAASALAFLASADPRTYRDFAGGGFRDTTRIAKSDPSMWLSIFRENPENIERGLREYSRAVSALADAVAAGDEAFLGDFLKKAREMRLSLDR